MEKYLIVYGSTEGHTRKVADFIAREVRSHGFDATVRDSLKEESIAPDVGYDGILVGASVHQGKHQSSVIHFVETNLEVLQALPSVFFSVSLEAALPGDEHQAAAERYISEFLEQTGWHPEQTWSVAGALRYTHYDFFKRFVMKLIARREGQDTDTAQDHEYTDWYALERRVEYFLKETHDRHEKARTAAQERE